MSPDRDPGRREFEGQEEYEEDAPRSIFSALWFRALLAVLVLGVLIAVAVPYVLDFATHQTSKTTAAKPPPPKATSAAAPAPVAPPATTPPAPAPSASPAPPPPSPGSTTPPVATAPPAEPTEPPATAAPAPVRPSARGESAKPAPKTAPAAKSKAVAKAADAPRVAETPRTAEAPRASEAPRVADAPPRAESPRAATKSGAARKGAARASVAATAAGPFWVQVGAFKDQDTARRLAARLNEQGFHAEQSTVTKGGGALAPAAPPPAAPAPTMPEAQGDRYHVVVSGAPAADVDAKLATKGLTSETTPGGVIVQPSLPLREAVALSRDLADAGLTVQVRRVGGPAPAAAAPAPAPAPAPARGGETLYRVRVGGYPDRATAVAALKQLEEKGFKPFIAPTRE